MTNSTLHIPTILNRYEDAYDSGDIFVTDAGQHGKMVGIGVVAEGKSAIQVSGGPRVAGPWAYSFGHAIVIDNYGSGVTARENALKVALGEEFTIENVSGVFAFREPKSSEGESPVLVNLEAAEGTVA
jgi:hypothetical protein